MTYVVLCTILPIAGWPEERAQIVEIGAADDPVLPTSFRLGEADFATLAAQ